MYPKNGSQKQKCPHIIYREYKKKNTQLKKYAIWEYKKK